LLFEPESGDGVRREAALGIVTCLTLARVPFVFLFATLAVIEQHHPDVTLTWAAFAAIVLASLTDLFDGYLARKWQVASRFGAAADPLMDKAFYIVVFPTLLYLLGRAGDAEATHTLVMLVFSVLYLLRDQWVSFLRSIGSAYQADLRANWMGKLRTAMSFPIGCAIYLYIAFGPLWWVPRWLIYTAEGAGIVVNLLSILVYTQQYLPYLRRSLKPEA
jgi:CDP-diacylglycerol--glycerol-3-phosphate 3-phosphatidyltransferase